MSGIPIGTDQLIAWLDDAHAMESGLIPILQQLPAVVSHDAVNPATAGARR